MNLIQTPSLDSMCAVSLPVEMSAMLDVLGHVGAEDEQSLATRLSFEPTLALFSLYRWPNDQWPTCLQLARDWIAHPKRYLDWSSGESLDFDTDQYRSQLDQSRARAASAISVGWVSWPVTPRTPNTENRIYLAGLVHGWLPESCANKQPDCWPEDELWQLIAAIETDDKQRNENDEVESASSPLQIISDLLIEREESRTSFADRLQQEKLRAMSGLAYGASHEINNPLANISTRAQTLLRDETDPEKRRKLSTINSQAFRAHEMISDMMLFAKPPVMKLGSCKVTEIVATVLGELTQQADSQGTQLGHCEFNGDLFEIEADATQLAVALKALVVNSLEALASGGSVAVELSWQDRDQLNISVTDTGPGMTDEVRNHLFDPFFSGREAGRGLGLGLSKCWRIVTEHNGTIVVDSNGHGTRFELTLPRQSARM